MAVQAEATKLALSLRERINADADPVGFLIKVMRGEAFETVYRGEVEMETAPLDRRVEIAFRLTSKILPDLRAIELSGTVTNATDSISGDALERIMGKLGRFVVAEGEESTTH